MSLPVVFVSVSSSGFYTAFLVFVESFDFSTKENVAVNYKTKGQCQEATGSGRQLPLSLITVLPPVGDMAVVLVNRRPMGQQLHVCELAFVKFESIEVQD